MLKAVEGFAKSTDMCLPLRSITGQCLVDFLIKISVEEGIVDIKLVNDSLFGSSNSHQASNIGHFDNNCKHLTIIQAFDLCVSLGD